MFRKRKRKLLDRLHTDEIARGAEALRERASDAASGAADALQPYAEAARDRVGPQVKKVKKARKAAVKRGESAWESFAPSVGQLAGSAIEAALARAEDTSKRTKSGRKEAARRAKDASAALRGKKVKRRKGSAVVALMLGAMAGAAAGVLSRKVTTPADPPSFPNPATRRPPSPPKATPPPPPAPPAPEPTVAPAPVGDMFEGAGPVLPEASADGTEAEAPAKASRPRPSPRPRAKKDAEDAS